MTSGYLGDFKAGKTVYLPFDTQVNGLPTTASAATVKVYKNAVTTTEVTTGVTTSLDFDSLTGMHMVAVDTSSDGAFYAAGNEYSVALTALTLSGSTVRIWLGSFSIENRAVNWAQVCSPTTAVNLSATNIDVDQVVASVSGAVGSVTGAVGSVTGLTAATVHADLDDIQARLPAALGANGNIKADVRDYSGTAGTFAAGRPEVNATHAAGTAWNSGAIGAATLASDTITAAKIATDAITAAKIAADAIGASELAADAVTEIQSGLSTLTQANVRTAVGLASANLDTQLDALPTNAELATALGTADDATLAAIAALVIPTAAQNRAEMDSNSTKLAAIATLFTTAMTESYNADGAAPTPAQALFVIMQRLTEFAIAGTTITAKKLDGSTTAFTLTLDDASNPTSSTRAT